MRRLCGVSSYIFFSIANCDRVQSFTPVREMSIVEKLNLLILCDKPVENYNANTIVDHIDSFVQYSRHSIFIFSNLGDIPDQLNLENFDVIIIHYSLSILFDRFISSSARKKIHDFQGLKVLFVQDEYRAINKMIAMIDFLGIDVLFTCFPDCEMRRIYTAEKLPNVSFYNNLTGYIPERLLTMEDPIPMAERPLDVGYRGRKLPYWYGELGYEKWHIVDLWRENTGDTGIKSDVSYREQDRIYGENWIAFIRSCRVMLGVESGASVMDFTGELEKQVDFYQLTHPHAAFHTVQALFFKNAEYEYQLNQISPRCFEAIALKTGLVLFEGEYSGILKPHLHYIPLKKDFSNINDVIAAIQNHDLLEEMVQNAWVDIACNPTYHYRAFIERVDDVIEHEFMTRNKVHVQHAYDRTIFLNTILQAVPWRKKIAKNLFLHYQRLPYHWRLIIKCLVRPKVSMLYVKQWFYRRVRQA